MDRRAGHGITHRALSGARSAARRLARRWSHREGVAQEGLLTERTLRAPARRPACADAVDADPLELERGTEPEGEAHPVPVLDRSA